MSKKNGAGRGGARKGAGRPKIALPDGCKRRLIVVHAVNTEYAEIRLLSPRARAVKMAETSHI